MYAIRLANIAGLDINNAQHSVAIDEALVGIENNNAFLEYCRDFKDSIQFSSKPERLDTLATKYKALQQEAILSKTYDAADKYARVIADLVVQCRNFIEDKCIDFSELAVEGNKFFAEHQIRALKQVGTTAAIIEYSRTNRLAGEIYKAYLENVKPKKPYEQLSEGQKKVQQLTQVALK